MLSSLTYSPALTGQAMSSAIQGVLKGMDVNAQTLGKTYWEFALLQLYTDFSTTLQNNVLTYLQQTEVMYAPGNKATLTFMGPPVFAPFMTKTSTSASIIDSNIKSICQGRKAVAQLGIDHWEQAITQIFADICEVTSTAINTSYTTSFHLVPVGSIAPPTIGTIAPVPALLQIPFVESALKGQLDGQFNAGAAKGLALEVHNQIQSQFNGWTKKAQQDTIGGLYWQIFIDKSKIKIQQYLGDAVKNWILSSPQHFAIPPGTPGTNPVGIPPTLPSAAPMLGFMM